MTAAVVGVLGGAIPGAGQDISFGGQVRPRFEFRDSSTAGSDAFTSMRVRADLTAKLDRGVRVFIQLQDVRFWGEESNTLTDFSADNFDLHQGYVEVRSGGQTTFSALVGRQEILFGGQRLVGPVGWAQQGRALDGVRLGAEGTAGRVALIGMQLQESILPEDLGDAYLFGAYATLMRVGPAKLDLYTLFNAVEDEADAETKQLTVGARWFGQYRAVVFRAESSYQAGERRGLDVAAFMVGARVGTVILGGSMSLTLWYDYLSGDADSGDSTVRVFDTLFATNHKFYGLADHFLNIPVQTAGRGLQDLALKGSYKPQANVALAAELHSFHMARSAGLATGHFGEEIDLSGSYRYSKQFRVVAGLSYLFAAGGFAEIGRFIQDGVWTYLMLDAAF